jgi:hypothetical protein
VIPLPETEEGQDRDNDHDETDKINDTVHDSPHFQEVRRSACAGLTARRAKMFHAERRQGAILGQRTPR